MVAIGTMSSNCSDGDVRLIDGSVDYEGRVEICINRVWGTVCSTTYRYYYYQRWDLSAAKVVCRQLGHQELGIIK
jgi:deleted-in-malignant-brain-tumors protein 1